MANEDYSEKAHVVRRMVQSGVELPMEKREALLRLRQKVEQLWEKREATQAQLAAQASDETGS